MKSFFDKHRLISAPLVLLAFMLSLFFMRDWLLSIDTIDYDMGSYSFDSDAYIKLLYIAILCFWIITCTHISLMQLGDISVGIIVGVVAAVIGALFVGFGALMAIVIAVLSGLAGVVYFNLCKGSSPLSYFLSLLVASLPLASVLFLLGRQYSGANEEMLLINCCVLGGSSAGAFVYLLLITPLKTNFITEKLKSR